MATADEGQIQKRCLEQMDNEPCEEAPKLPEEVNAEEKKGATESKNKSTLDMSDDEFMPEEDFGDEELHLQWLCQEEPPVTPEKTVVEESPDPGQSAASTEVDTDTTTPGSTAGTEGTPSVATVESPIQENPTPITRELLPERTGVGDTTTEREATAKVELKFLDVPLGPPPKKRKIKGKTDKNVPYARVLDITEDETYADISHAEFAKWVHSKKNAANDVEMKRLYKLGYRMVRAEYVKEKQKSMDPKEKRANGWYQNRVDSTKAFTKLPYLERRDYAFKMYKDLGSQKEKVRCGTGLRVQSKGGLQHTRSRRR